MSFPILLFYACASDPCASTEQLCDTNCIPIIASTTESLYENIFSKSCAFSSCHGESSAGQLALDQQDTLEAMINTPSSQVPERKLIVPGSPEDSYLMHKLKGENMASGTELMPPGIPLCESKQSAIADWITEL